MSHVIHFEKIKNGRGAVTSPKMQIPGVGDSAYCSDLEGLAFGVIQEKKRT
jgi:predicted enzyme related to lactoylglutathione lyase